MTVTMLDGINADARAIHAFNPRVPVGTYINGIFAWSPAEEALFARKIRISVESGQPSAARHARCLDVERGDAQPIDVLPFLAERAKLDNKGTIYCSLAEVPAVLSAVGGDVALVPRWWLAWYWQRPGFPSITQVLDELRKLTGKTVPAERLWACQYVPNVPIGAGAADFSVVYGTPDFSR